MRRQARAATALFALCIALSWSPGAGAGPAITAAVDAPQEGDVVVGTVDVRASAHSAAGVKRIEISIDGFGVASKEPGGLQQDASAAYSWSSNEGIDSASVIANGRHSITVHAVATGGADDSASVEVETNNPPAVPTGLSATADGGAVTVSWSANPEPDLIGYVVERDSGSGFVEVGRIDEPELAEGLVAGAYAYRVTAVRNSPVDPDGIASAASAPVSVTVAASSSGGSGAVTRLTGKHALGGGKGLGRGAGAGAGLSALLSGRSLPHAGALPAIPSPAGLDWGSYDRDLPYGDAPAAVPPELRSRPVASSSGPLSLVPPDGLRWVAAGLLLLVCAALTQLLAALELPAPPLLVMGRKAIVRWFTRAEGLGPRGWRRPG